MNDEELSPRERRYQRTQQAILDAARTLLSEGGADKLSIRAIADRIDYSPAGLYEYYSSKEEIISALSREGHRTLRRYMAQVPLTMPPGEYIVEIGVAYIQFAVQNPDYFLLIFSSPPVRSNDEEGASARPTPETMSEDSAFLLLVRGVERAVEKGTVRLLEGLGILETSYAFWCIVHGAAMLRVSHLNYIPMDFDQTDRLMLEAFVRGMGSKK